MGAGKGGVICSQQFGNDSGQSPYGYGEYYDNYVGHVVLIGMGPGNLKARKERRMQRHVCPEASTTKASTRSMVPGPWGNLSSEPVLACQVCTAQN